MIEENWNGEEFQDKLHDKLGEALEEVATEIEFRAQQIVPVQTGDLQESIRHETDKIALEALIGSDCTYALYVELGTRKMAAKPYLRPAAYESDYSQYFVDLM